MEYLSFHSDWLFLFVAFEPMGGKVAVFGIIFYLMAGIWKEKTETTEMQTCRQRGRIQVQEGKRTPIKIVRTRGCALMGTHCNYRGPGLEPSWWVTTIPNSSQGGSEAFSHFLWHQSHRGTHTYVKTKQSHIIKYSL